eukprot:CAMPEP_0170066626 /NCGR_PEP_ID=MMETSP0019_2-20121128/6257_1 /TAXON_ID=98059 /ORGANISM="Dinobryon sp., Strain UTEXLB2267" /LENGTH=57 /DNA_ID=CAMNT_0010273771 /DNA_START=94 /DNA_END=267 /DNA_ORIENTATION=+
MPPSKLNHTQKSISMSGDCGDNHSNVPKDFPQDSEKHFDKGPVQMIIISLWTRKPNL